MTAADQIAAVIRNFPFWDYGIVVNPGDRHAEWVGDLAQRVADEVCADHERLVDLLHRARNDGVGDSDTDTDWGPVDDLLRRLRPDEPFREPVWRWAQ